MSQPTSPWVQVTLADVQACLLAEALSLAQARAAQRQQADPFGVHLPKVVARVRAKVANAPGAVLSGDALAVPPELADQTALLVAHAVVLPLAAGNPHLFGDDARAAVARAEQDLDDVAAGRLAVSLPVDGLPSNPVASSGRIQPVSGNPRESTRDALRGL